MEIKTRFALGDKVWKVENSKAVCFEVCHIAYDGAVYYGTCSYDTCVETQCFATKEELIKYLSDDE